MITGNKGEWSEIYALFKLLSEKKMFAGDADLNKVEGLFYPIIRIIRNESGGSFEYALNDDLVIISGGVEELRIPVSQFIDQSVILLAKIKELKSTFSIPEIEEFMSAVNCHTLKAKSSSKTDIRIVFYDQKINQTAELGFSIKSQLGGDATLLYAGKTTNFIYRLDNFDPTADEISVINGISTRSKIKDRVMALIENGAKFTFTTLEQDIFKNNLVLIDSLLPNILAEIIQTFFSSSLTSIKDLIVAVNNANPLNYNTQFAHTFYEYKIKRFLADVALGMMPSKVWDGVYDATGGYLIVKEDGEVLCYHIYNRNQFEDYLFSNTKLETASSTRHDFGKIYEDGGQFFIKLNLQIRFK